MVESKLEEEIVSNEIIEEYFRNKHVLLLYLARKEEIGIPATVIDAKKAFTITKKYAWALLEKLEKDKSIEKSGKVTIEGADYHTYILTAKAKRDLQVISSCLRTYCQNSKSSECPYSQQFRMKITPKKSNVV